MHVHQQGYIGELPPVRFNMARYCLEAAARTTPDKVALMVVSDAHAPIANAECWTYRGWMTPCDAQQRGCATWAWNLANAS